jgi:hypothetical protein
MESMSWGYWGIVIGLVTLVAMFFVCLNLLYSGHRDVSQSAGGFSDGLSNDGEERAEPSRRAA